MGLKLDWNALATLIASAVLGSNPKTAPIVNEVTKGITDAEGLFRKGEDKKAHVLELARTAAQAVDELRGGEDDVVGQVGTAVDKVVDAANAIHGLIK